MEGRTKCVAKQWSGKGPAEPRNGGGALALSVELAEEHYGRAKKKHRPNNQQKSKLIDKKKMFAVYSYANVFTICVEFSFFTGRC